MCEWTNILYTIMNIIMNAARDTRTNNIDTVAAGLLKKIYPSSKVFNNNSTLLYCVLYRYQAVRVEWSLMIIKSRVPGPRGY